MTDNDEVKRVLPFAGLTRFDKDVELPDDVFGHGSSMRWWAKEQTQDDDEPAVEDLPDKGLHSRVADLPRASTAEVAWKHPVTGEWVNTAKHNAVINPQTAEDIEWGLGTSEEAQNEGITPEDVTVGDDALYNIPTSDYTVINPSQFLRPLGEVIQDEGLDDAVFGEFRLHRGGGRVSADVFFNGKHVEHPDMDDDRAPIVVGMQLDWDFFGDTALRIQGCGMDWECTNAIRSMTDTVIVKHAGDVQDRVDWKEKFESVMEDIDLKADQLSQIIAEASQTHFDVSDLPEDFDAEYDSVLEALYAYSGLPDYLAEYASNSLRADAADPFEPNWWEIHRGATDAITHHGRGEVGTGGAVEQYHRLANDMLVNPAGIENRMVENYEADRDDDTLREEAGGVADIQQAFSSVRDRKEQYEKREREIETMLANVE